MQLEHIILRELCLNTPFRQKALSYLKEEYFTAPESKKILGIINSHVQKYQSNHISYDILDVEIANAGLSEALYKRAKDFVQAIKDTTDPVATAWLIDQTEKFCQERAVAAALMKAVTLYEENKSKGSTALGAIPEILGEALKVSFEESMGHDYWEDAELAFDKYTQIDAERFRFNKKYLDLITQGGIARKTLNIVIAGTGGGKTIFMCDAAANFLMQGKNVLYLTGEMAEEKIRERIDANLLDIEVNKLKTMSKTVFLQRIKKLHGKTAGRLKIKEFEEGGATTALTFARWLDEYKAKENFVPDIIIVDYLTLLGSSRVKLSQGSYTVGKAVAEEIRALGKRYNSAILTGAQFNRSGMDNSDPGLGNTSESVGIPFTADLILAIVKTGNLVKLSQVCFKQLKNRYNDENFWNKFVMGLDKPKMRFYDVEDSAQINADEVDIEFTEEQDGYGKIHSAAKSNGFDPFS